MPAIVVPHLGYATGESTVLRWLKAVGEPLDGGEPLLELASEKTVHVVVARAGGTLLATYALPGAIVPEGETVGWIGEPSEAAPARRCRILGWEETVAPRPPDFQELFDVGAPRPAEKALSPVLDGPPATIGREYRAVLRNQLRQVTAQRMSRSWQEAPKVDLFAEVDFSRVQVHRQTLKSQGREAPSFNIYIVQAVVKAFQDLPALNLHWVEGRAEPWQPIDVGMAVALGDNLVTVSAKNLAGVDLFGIQRHYKALIRKALQMSLSRDELYGSSLTVTNLGEFDVSAFTAVINPPEIYILAIGKVEDRAVVVDGEIVVRSMCTFCLSFDHRAVDGAPASRLLQRIKQHMEQDPEPV